MKVHYGLVTVVRCDKCGHQYGTTPDEVWRRMFDKIVRLCPPCKFVVSKREVIG